MRSRLALLLLFIVVAPKAAVGKLVPIYIFRQTPTSNPTSSPSLSHRPSSPPSLSHRPSSRPNSRPSHQPSLAPSMQPSNKPTSYPSFSLPPSHHPTSYPSSSPSTYQPSLRPSSQPSSQPLSSPSRSPSSYLRISSTFLKSNAMSTSQPSGFWLLITLVIMILCFLMLKFFQKLIVWLQRWSAMYLFPWRMRCHHMFGEHLGACVSEEWLTGRCQLNTRQKFQICP